MGGVFPLVSMGNVTMRRYFSRTLKRNALRAIVLGSFVFGLYLLYLLSTQISPTSDIAQTLPKLLGVGVALIVVLLSLVGAQILVTVRRFRANVFGSKLTVRLVLVFTLVALVPGLVMYTVSVKFLAGSVESWFDVRVDRALEGGLNLGRANLENGLRELQSKADSMAASLSYQGNVAQMASIHSLRDQAAISEATVFSISGEIVASSGVGTDSIIPRAPSQTMLRQAQLQQPYAAFEEDGDDNIFLRVIVPINRLDEEMQILQAIQVVPQHLAEDAARVQEAYQDYQQLSLSKYGLKRLYTMALTLSLVLALLSVVLMAVMFSNRLSAPLGFLAAGTRAVAQGDYRQRAPISRQDELGFLTESFSVMTGQLSEAREAAEQHQSALTQANAYLTGVLETLSAGVLTFDDQLKLRAYNPSAQRILGGNLGNLLSDHEEYEKQEGFLAIKKLILDRSVEGGSTSWEHQTELQINGSKTILLVRGAVLQGGNISGFVVAFEDVTNLLQAQRSALWGEVAQRLAHEIKNPLTPIQLSAERLTHRLSNKLEPADSEMLDRSIKTIVDQVAALKTMVNAFNEYSRNPQSKSIQLNINDLVIDVADLYRASDIKLKLELAPDVPDFYGDTGKLRQVLHNLIQNSEQALSGRNDACVTIETKMLGAEVELVLRDNGPGFSEEVLERAFDPYFTTKAKGTGLGLAIVKKIIEEHDGQVRLSNVETGAVIEIKFPIANRSDLNISKKVVAS